MHITLIPVRMDAALTLHRAGDVLTVNGVAYDFGPLPEGAVLPATAVDCDWIAGAITRAGGVLQLSLILPHGPDAPHEARFPAPISAPNGPIDLPPHDGALP